MKICKPQRPGTEGGDDVVKPCAAANDNRPDPTERDDEIMRLPDVQRAVALSRSTIYRLKAEGKFPQSRSLTGRRAVGWRRGDIRAWLTDRRRG